MKVPVRKKKGKPKGATKKLNLQQEKFAHLYVKCLNATQAAREAGYKHPHVQGPRLLDHVSVHLLIEKLKNEALQKIQMSREDVLVELARIARSNIKNVFNANGHIMSPDQMDEDVAAAVESFEARLEFAADGAPPEEIRKIKMHSKLGALKVLAQHHGIIGADVQVNLGAALADRLAAARKRARGKE